MTLFLNCYFDIPILHYLFNKSVQNGILKLVVFDTSHGNVGEPVKSQEDYLLLQGEEDWTVIITITMRRSSTFTAL